MKIFKSWFVFNFSTSIFCHNFILKTVELLFFLNKINCKVLKNPKNRVRSSNEAGKSTNQRNYEPHYPQIGDYWVENEVELEISKL